MIFPGFKTNKIMKFVGVVIIKTNLTWEPTLTPVA